MLIKMEDDYALETENIAFVEEYYDVETRAKRCRLYFTGLDDHRLTLPGSLDEVMIRIEQEKARAGL